jgi:hypothetical protein
MGAHDVFEMTSELSLADHVYGRSTIVYGGIQGGAHYNGVHKHNGLLLFQREVSQYKHNGEIVYGDGLIDRFASDDISVALQTDFNDTMPSRDELVITGVADHTDTFDAANDILEITAIIDGNLIDTATIEEGSLETELIADFVDVEAISEAVDPHAITLDLKDRVDMDEEFEISMTGYWTYGDMTNPKHTHDGSIAFNYGTTVPV